MKYKNCHLGRDQDLFPEPDQSDVEFLRQTPEFASTWKDYCQRAYGGKIEPLFVAALLDIGDAADLIEQAMWRFQFTALQDHKDVARKALTHIQRQLQLAVISVNELASQARAIAATPRETTSALLKWEEENERSPSITESMLGYSDFALEMFSADSSKMSEFRQAAESYRLATDDRVDTGSTRVVAYPVIDEEFLWSAPASTKPGPTKSG